MFPHGESRVRGLLRIAATLATTAALAAHLAIRPLAAETYPDRPIRLIIPFSAGGPNDLIARPLAEAMSETRD
jgi:tripartite-type tricarboxylate transporter receptor subunit TctC